MAAPVPERLFTEEQLAAMSEGPLERLNRAIDAGQKEQAKELAQLLYNQFAHLHDGYMCWIAGLLTWIYEQGGTAAVAQAERSAHAKEAQLVFLPPERTDAKSMVEHMASELKGHVHQPMTITEDDEKIIIENAPCGSGGRLIKMGAYEPEIGMARIAQADPLTFSTEDYPVYCVHCALFNQNAVDTFGHFLFCNNPPDAQGQACQFIFYKNPADIPEEYYTRIGRQKPA